MAKKGQTFNTYDLAFKQKILKLYKQGHSARSLMKTYGVPTGTISTWLRIEKKYGGLEVAKRGKPKGSNDKDYQERYEILKKFQDFLVDKEPEKR